MRIYVAVLTSTFVGVLVGAAVVYALRADEIPVQTVITGLPNVVIEADLNEHSLTLSSNEYSQRLDSYVQVQSIRDIQKLENDFDQRFALYRFMREADRDDLERYIAESIEISSSNQRMVALSVIFARYALLDPYKALERALAHDRFTQQERRNLVWWIFNEWTVADLDEAIDAIQLLPQEFKQSAATAIMWRSDGLPVDERVELAQRVGPNESWVDNTVDSMQPETYKDDPRKAYYDRLRDTTRTSDRFTELSKIASHWFESEGVAVLTEIYDSLTSVDERRGVLDSLIWNIEDIDNATAVSILEVVSQFPNQLAARNSTDTVFQHWANSDPKAAFETALVYDDQAMSDDLRSRLLSHWSYKDAEGLFDEALNLPSRFQGVAISNSLRKIAIDSPQEAIQLARTLDTRVLRTSARDAIASGWRVYDAKSAFEWLESNDLDVNARSNESLWRTTFSEYLDHDYDDARTYVDQYEGEFKEQLVEVTAKHLFANDLERAMAYMKRENPDISESLLHTIAYSLAQSDPVKAFDYGETLDQHLQEQYYESVIYSSSYLNFKSLHDNILGVPQKHRSLAASKLLHENEEMHYLSDLEIQKLESMIEEDRKFTRLDW